MLWNFMSRNPRRKIFLVLAVLLLPVSLWGLQSRAQTQEDVCTSIPPLGLDSNLGQETPCPVWLFVIKWSQPHEIYVELTEEELEQFPGIQPELQEFTASDRSEMALRVYNPEASRFVKYIYDKHKTKYEGPAYGEGTFKYQEEFYYVVNIRPRELESPQVTEQYAS